MKIAVEGCCHGDLDKIYETLLFAEEKNGFKIDLLICCGDFQAVRNTKDLCCLNVPQKFLEMKDFHKYYSGERIAPIPTIFIGGNHEAGNHNWELYFGGFAAPNIYYLGHSGVINFGGITIAGFSGIFKDYDYKTGYHETIPYNEKEIRSVYHTREFEIFKLSNYKKEIDIMLSHDWPSNITMFGDEKRLLQFKKHLRNDIEKGNLGSPAGEFLLKTLKPKYWFSSHLHCKFTAIINHSQDNKSTKFLALDKCLPNRDFLQILDIDINDNSIEKSFHYDLEWLSIIKLSQKYFSTNKKPLEHPKKLDDNELKETQNWILEKFKREKNENLKIPNNFIQNVDIFLNGENEVKGQEEIIPPNEINNPQTNQFLEFLEMENKISQNVKVVKKEENPDEIDLDL